MTNSCRPTRRQFLLAPIAVSLIPASAQAHAVLVASEPAANATVVAGALTFVLRFNSRIDKSRSRADLVGANGERPVLTISPAGPDDTLQIPLIAPPGGNTLRWQVLATDGHITRGEVPFIAVKA